VVVEDGYSDVLSQGEAEQRLLSLAEMFPGYRYMGVESSGEGRNFAHSMMRHTALKIVPLPTGNKSKSERFEKELAPWFEFSRAWLSSKETDFMHNFVSEWLGWPFADHDDHIDSVYWLMRAASAHLQPLRTQAPAAPPGYGRQPSPYLSLTKD
jgi:hypothetical protein